MRWFFRLTDGVRKYFLRRGYTCDNCGRELFAYPSPRLCPACAEKLQTPERPCPLCGRACVAEGLCMDCKETPPPFTRGVSPFVYRGQAAMLINRVKKGNAKLAVYLGERMAAFFIKTCAELTGEPLLLLPVPMTKARRRERGYNQAERLAEGVCAFLCEAGIEAETDFTLLVKTRETKPQKGMSRKERAENVRGAYRVVERKKCKGKTVVLVDDVTTTGSTGNEIAQKLLQAGAKEVYFLTAAAVPEAKE